MTASTVRLGAVCFGVFAFVFLADFMFASHRFTSRAVLSPHAAVSAFVDQQQQPQLAKRVLKAEDGPLDPSLHGDYRRAKMDDYQSQRTAQCDEGAGGWQSVDMARSGIFATSLYGDRHVKPQLSVLDPDEERYVGLQVCETFDDASEESGWKIYRIGPFVGTGGGDWHQVWLHPIPHPERAKFITGKLAAPVDARGAILGHPPLYSHHVHVELNGVQHPIETHGDTTCSEESGGDACYLRSYPEGYGLPFDATVARNGSTGDDGRDFIALNFMLSDLREFPAPPMVFYEEIALKWTAREDLKPMSIHVQHMLKGGDHPFATVLVTKRPSFLWSTSKWLVDGNVVISPQDQFPWFHTHRKFCGAAWVFAATPEELGLTTDLLQVVDDNENVHQETRPGDLVWNPPESEDPIASLLRRVGESEAGLASLRCWLAGSEEEKVLEHVNATDASSAYPEAWRQNWIEGWYDRAGEVHCDEWSFKSGDDITVVTLNGLDTRVPDLDLYTQHGVFFLPYESSVGGELGPSYEVYGGQSTEAEHMFMLPYSYLPKQSAATNAYDGGRDDDWRSEAVLGYLKDGLGIPGARFSARDSRKAAAFYRGKAHQLYQDAELGLLQS